MQSSQTGTINRVIENNHKLIVLVFFAVFFVTGSMIYKDYGLSWDENAQWQSNGYSNYNFIVHHDKATLLKSPDKYHGPAFELVLIFFEKIFKLSDSRDIFLMRHFVTFFTFFISSVFFYFLALKIFKNRELALINFLFYVLSPTVFSHAFYNSKDIVFLSFFVISIYALIVFHEKQTYRSAAFYAVAAAFAIDVRIIGILIPLISGLFFMLDLFFAFYNKTKFQIKFLNYALYVILLIPLIILFWPVLWLNPVYYFIEALKENSYYHWQGSVLYFGKPYFSTDLPWHYLLFWDFISKPVLYSALFLIGTAACLKAFVFKPLLFLQKNKNDLMLLIWFFAPLFIIIFFKSVVFDTGRHMYFMHGAFVLIALRGLEAVYNFLKGKKIITYTFNVLLLFSFAFTIKSMIKLHPYEHLYFNSFAGNDMKKIKDNFELDYWGLSSREVLENILRKDSSKQIKVFNRNFPQYLNSKILFPEQRERLIYTKTPEEAQYYLADYRYEKEEDYPYHKELYSVMVGNAKIATAFKIQSFNELYYGSNYKKIMSFSNNFEDQPTKGTNTNIVELNDNAHSGSHVTSGAGLTEYGNIFNLSNLDLLCNKKNIVLRTSVWKYDNQPKSQSKLIVRITSADGKTYFCYTLNEFEADPKELKTWQKKRGAVELPMIKSANDTISIYLLNSNKTQIFMDDMEITFMQGLD